MHFGAANILALEAPVLSWRILFADCDRSLGGQLFYSSCIWEGGLGFHRESLAMGGASTRIEGSSNRNQRVGAKPNSLL